MRLLIVDDDPLAGEMVAAVLEDVGHEVEVVESGAVALDLLTDGGFDGVVSDMVMPGLSGLDLFAALRQRGLSLPFILLSGDEPEALASRGIAVSACLRKDADLPDSLPSVVSAVFGVDADG